MSMVLQQSLRGLCYKSGWSYAVFWKLKRRSRMVLTWEDGFYEFPMSSKTSSMDGVEAANNVYATSKYGCSSGNDPFGPDVPGVEDQVGLVVARMSYHVYSLGEGIIGRVAFTGKHQWVFGTVDKGTTAEGHGSGRLGARSMQEKYPAGWQQQFTAGIKTIAVVAVPQGVVQLGSTQTIMEDLTLVSHVRALFGTLQSVPGAFLSDYVPEPQGFVSGPCPMVVPRPLMMPIVALSDSARSMNMIHLHPGQMNMSRIQQPRAYVVSNNSFGMRNVCKASSMLARAHQIDPYLPSHINPPSSQKPKVLPGAQLGCGNSLLRSLASSIVPVSLDTSRGSADVPSSSVCTPRRSAVPVGNLFPDNPRVLSSATDSWSCAPSVPPVLPLLVTQNNIGKVFGKREAADHQSHHALDSSTHPCDRSVSQDIVATLEPPYVKSPGSISNLASRRGACLPTISSLSTSRDPFGKLDTCNRELLRESKVQTSAFEGLGMDAVVKGPLVQNKSFNTNQVTGLQSGQAHRSSSHREIPTIPLHNFTMGEVAHQSKLSLGAKLTYGSPSKDASTTFLNVPKAELMEGCEFRGTVGTNQEVFGQFPCYFLEVTETAERSESIAQGLGNEVFCRGQPVSDVEEDFTGFVGDTDRTLDCSSSIYSHFPIGDELSQALRPALGKEADSHAHCVLHPQHSDVDCKENINGQQVEHIEVASDGAKQRRLECLGLELEDFGILLSHTVLMDSKPEPLLDAMVAGISSNCVDYPPNPTMAAQEELTMALCSTAASESDCTLTRIEHPAGESPEDGPAPEVYLCNGEKVVNLQLHSNGSQGEAVSDKTLSLSNGNREEGKRRNCDERSPLGPPSIKGNNESPKLGSARKRLKPGDSPRPRPKDRQQIQDRVRELREIVPNANKCSIDVLLERTIKHMHFLQSVTQLGGKWTHSKDWKMNLRGSSPGFGEESVYSRKHKSTPHEVVVIAEQQKVAEQDTEARTSPIEDLDNGESVGIDFGVQSRVCPIVVEDLNEPRKMLIEMLCGDKDLFLEIADTVRGLGFSILKGSTEHRGSKTWARFIVEATRDVHRVEVLWSLMQLFQASNIDSSAANYSRGIQVQDNTSSPSSYPLFQPPTHLPMAGRLI